MQTFTVDAPNISRAWLEACEQLAKFPGTRAFHTVVRIAQPLREDAQLRSELDRLRSARTVPLYPIDTVVSTLFPVGLANTCRSHEELAERYRTLYPRLRKVRRNAHGTYFGRLIAYPGAGCQDRARRPDRPGHQPHGQAPYQRQVERGVRGWHRARAGLRKSR